MFMTCHTNPLPLPHTAPIQARVKCPTYTIVSRTDWLRKQAVSIKHELRTGYKIRTRYKMRTGKYGLGIKQRLQAADWV